MVHSQQTPWRPNTAPNPPPTPSDTSVIRQVKIGIGPEGSCHYDSMEIKCMEICFMNIYLYISLYPIFSFRAGELHICEKTHSSGVWEVGHIIIELLLHWGITLMVPPPCQSHLRRYIAGSHHGDLTQPPIILLPPAIHQ